MITGNTISTIYVSQKNGNDNFSGFYKDNKIPKNGPLKTIEKAIEKIIIMRSFGIMQEITIKILDEVYYIEKPICIDLEKASNHIYTCNTGTLNIKIEPYSKTLISGGKKLSGFCEDTFNGVKCFSKEIPEVKDGKLFFTDFYVNGKRADFTRFPSENHLKPLAVENNGEAYGDSSSWFIAEKEDLEKIKTFKNFSDCIISFNHHWIDEHTPIKSYDLETGKIEFEYRTRFTICEVGAAAMRYVIENTQEAFKNPNEWYLDRNTGKVYYIPENENLKAEDIIAFAPITNKFIIIKGTPDMNAENIRIEGFDFAYTRGDYRSTDSKGNVYASDIQSVCNAFGAIEFYFAKHCRI